MLSRKITWLVLGFLLVGLVAVSSVSAVELGTEPPDFELTSLNGETVRLADFRGQPIILKLATTWCPSCKQQQGELAKIEDFLIANKIMLIEVYINEQEETVRNYMKDWQFKLPHATLVDDGRAARAYRVYTIPRIILIDSDFKVQRDRNLILAGDLQKVLQQMLKPKP